MSTYYVNAGASTQDGLTPETGYNKLSTLLASLIQDNDVIEIVDNGIVDEGNLALQVNYSITIKSFEFNVFKPTVKIKDMILNRNANLYDITFIPEISTGRQIILNHNYNYDISRCTFDKIFISTAAGEFDSEIRITNNIFKNISANYMIKIEGFLVFICNNTFYNGDTFIVIQSCSAGSQILNNVFDTAIPTTYSAAIVGPNNSNIKADYNLDYNITGAVYYQIDTVHGPVFPETRNIHNVDPSFIDPVNGDFTFVDGSIRIGSGICIGSGINHESTIEYPVEQWDASIPEIDFYGSVRPQNGQTDLGCYQWIPVYPTTTTTTTFEPTTTTTPAPVPPESIEHVLKQRLVFDAGITNNPQLYNVISIANLRDQGGLATRAPKSSHALSGTNKLVFKNKILGSQKQNIDLGDGERRPGHK